jgi:hypothetical protein
MIASDNAPDEVIGTILSERLRDGTDVRAEIIIHDTDAAGTEGNCSRLIFSYHANSALKIQSPLSIELSLGQDQMKKTRPNKLKNLLK